MAQATPTTERNAMCMHDPEVPAGYQDADLLQAQYEAESAEYMAAVARGECRHSWTQGVAQDGTWPDSYRIGRDRNRGHFPMRPTNYDRPAQGMVLCLDCGLHVPDRFAGME